MCAVLGNDCVLVIEICNKIITRKAMVSVGGLHGIDNDSDHCSIHLFSAFVCNVFFGGLDLILRLDICLCEYDQ